MEPSRTVRIALRRSSSTLDNAVAQPSLQLGEQFRTKRDSWPCIAHEPQRFFKPELHQGSSSANRAASPHAGSPDPYGERARSKGKRGVDTRQPRALSPGSSTSPRLSKSSSQKRSSLPTIMEKKYTDAAIALQGRAIVPRVKRWDTATRTTSYWDGLRRDSELFWPRGNCLVHFHDKGHSRRGPSLKVPMERIYASRFASLISIVHTEFGSHVPMDNLQYGDMQGQCDLYIPARDESSRKEAFTWHITTRNFFAFILGRPVVGISLGRALIDLRDRLDLFRPNDNHNTSDFMVYLERIGYLDLAHCPDYALAILNFAEHFKMQELWVDAFVHCVGMNQQLNRSSEFKFVSRVTQALITRAYLEMDLHLGRVMKSMSNFLEQDFSSSQFGASSGARFHLDRFRTFLHSHYVEKYGYWPPPRTAPFSKALYKSLYFDFRALHDYLVDLDSTDALSDQMPAAGGICVLQNVKAFDARHKFIPLPNPHPLLPRNLPIPKVQTHRSFRGFKRTVKAESNSDTIANQEALRAATNSSDRLVMSAGLVKAYQRFERECAERIEEKLSVTDARKVRWLLIYGTLQMLISILRAPKEVRITETVYPLCCLVTGNPPWRAGTRALNSKHTPSVLPPPSHTDTDSVAESSVHPDCEGESFFPPPSLLSSDTSSASPTDHHAPPVRTFTAPASNPAPSIRSLSRGNLFRNTSTRSIQTIQNISDSISSFARRSSRRASMPAPNVVGVDFPSKPAVKSNFCEIKIQGYGNGLNDTSKEQIDFVPSELSTEVLPEIFIAPQSRSIPLRTKAGSSKLDNLYVQRQATELQAHSLSQPRFSEPSRTPLMDTFSSECTLPGLEEFSDTPSSHSSVNTNDVPVARTWSFTRSASPQSASSATSNGASTPASEHRFSVSMHTITQHEDASTAATYPPSESLPKESTSRSPLQSPSSVVSRDPLDLPMVVAIEELRVYQPTGAPSVMNKTISNYSNDSLSLVGDPFDDTEDDEFPTRPGHRHNVANKAGVFKTSLRKTKTLAQDSVLRRRSARIGVEPISVDGTRRWSRIGFGNPVVNY